LRLSVIFDSTPVQWQILPMRIIRTKYRTYELPDDAQGIPAEQYFPGVELAAPLTGAKVYQTSDGPVVALPPRPAARYALLEPVAGGRPTKPQP
jgi:hypothetical protein